MAQKKEEDQRVDVDFESHPPIESDLDGIASLLRQTLLNYADCTAIAHHLIQLKEVTQVIALEASDEDEEDPDDEPDNDIYGVSSVINLTYKDQPADDPRKPLVKFLKTKSTDIKTLFESTSSTNKLAFIVNERYINLPPQLSLPTLNTLTQYINESQFSHLIFVAKILVRAKNSDLPNKKLKFGDSSRKPSEPLIFVNPEEEIIFESADNHVDIDVSSQCDENATWSLNSDVKYVPHRRILVVDAKNWTNVIKNLEKELS